MMKKKTPDAPLCDAQLPEAEGEVQAGMKPEKAGANETAFETVAGYCSVLVVCLFIITFMAQGFVIPSGSMEKTLLVGDHLMVDRITWRHRRSGCRWFAIESPGVATWWCLKSR